jgi:hypothetical protein
VWVSAPRNVTGTAGAGQRQALLRRDIPVLVIAAKAGIQFCLFDVE